MPSPRTAPPRRRWRPDLDSAADASGRRCIDTRSSRRRPLRVPGRIRPDCPHLDARFCTDHDLRQRRGRTGGGRPSGQQIATEARRLPGVRHVRGRVPGQRTIGDRRRHQGGAATLSLGDRRMASTPSSASTALVGVADGERRLVGAPTRTRRPFQTGEGLPHASLGVRNASGCVRGSCTNAGCR